MARLDKVLSLYDVDSRSRLKKRIRQQGVLINHQKVFDERMDVKENDFIQIDEFSFTYHSKVYYMMNKASNRISSHESNQMTIYDDIDSLVPNDLFSIGRLDKDTTGLIILTNDGQYAHQITNKHNQILKRYLVTCQNKLGDEVKKLTQGIDLKDDGIVWAKTLEVISETQIILGITDGKYHQVKRMIHAINNEVTQLHRLSIGQCQLDQNLAVGQLREMTKKEIEESLWSKNR